jgi:hypothetical protein
MNTEIELISDDDCEDHGIGKAIIEVKTGEFIDTEEFLRSLHS